jgi:hypothetical protein
MRRGNGQVTLHALFNPDLSAQDEFCEQIFVSQNVKGLDINITYCGTAARFVHSIMSFV